MSEKQDDMIPRIEIRDRSDSALIIQALGLYSLQSIQSVQMGSGGAINHLDQAASLMKEIYERSLQKLTEERENEQVEELRETLESGDFIAEFIKRFNDDDNN